MIKPYNILKKSRITEKAGELTANFNQYTFEVYPHAHKKQIAAAVEKVFSVKVTRVNTLNNKGKIKQLRSRKRVQPGLKNAFKKAIVSLKKEDKIEWV